jgi:GTP-binding protein Era
MERTEGLLKVHATLVVERDSQKGIVIGKGGHTLKAIGLRAREEMELFLGTKVFLDLRVKVLKEWQRDPKALQRLGF